MYKQRMLNSGSLRRVGPVSDAWRVQLLPSVPSDLSLSSYKMGQSRFPLAVGQGVQEQKWGGGRGPIFPTECAGKEIVVVIANIY